MPRSKKTNFDKNLRSLQTDGFYSDFQTEGILHSVLIRSPAPIGKIKSITISDLPKDYFLYTSQDIPGSRQIKINDCDIKIFGYDNVSYTGEPLAILVGPDKKELYKLVENVSIDFQVQSLESALENVIKKEENKKKKSEDINDLSNLVETLNEMPSLDTVIDKTHIDNNEEEVIAKRLVQTGLYKNFSIEEVENQIKTEEDLVSSNTWSYTLNAPTWEETTGAYSYMEDDILHIFAPTKWTKLLMDTISSCLEIPFENIVVHKTQTSSIFSKGIWRSTILAAQVAIAAYLTKKPVILEYSQQEQNDFMCPGVKADFTYKTIFNKEGLIKSNYINIDIDVGSANPFAQEITDRLVIASTNYYTTENLYINAKAIKSKNPPTSINLKSVCSQAFFAAENQIRTLSQMTQLYPSEIRKINTNSTNESFPFQINLSDYENAFLNTVKISDFNRKNVCFNMDVKRRLENSNPFFALPLRGIGIATAYNNSGYYGASSISYNQKIKVTLNTDNKVLIHAIKPSQEVEEIWKKTVSEVLEIKTDNIEIDSLFNINEIPESPDDSFSSIGNINEVLKKCCVDIQKRRFHEPLPLESQKSLTIRKEWDKENFCGNPFGTTSFIALVAEVELDSYTFNEKIKGIWITIDCGEILDKVAAIRKIRLEIQQVLSMLVTERKVPCDNITIEFVDSGNKSGQIGELIQNTLPAAFSSALSQALGIQMTELPCTENQIYQYIKERENKKTEETVTSENEDKEEKGDVEEK